MKHYAPYIIVQLVDVFQHRVVLIDSRRVIQTGAFSVMDLCTDKEYVTD